nr:MAG TPA: hypothetical protein [Caudoviricetes sp.]
MGFPSMSVPVVSFVKNAMVKYRITHPPVVNKSESASYRWFCPAVLHTRRIRRRTLPEHLPRSWWRWCPRFRRRSPHSSTAATASPRHRLQLVPAGREVSVPAPAGRYARLPDHTVPAAALSDLFSARRQAAPAPVPAAPLFRRNGAYHNAVQALCVQGRSRQNDRFVVCAAVICGVCDAHQTGFVGGEVERLADFAAGNGRVCQIDVVRNSGIDLALGNAGICHHGYVQKRLEVGHAECILCGDVRTAQISRNVHRVRQNNDLSGTVVLKQHLQLCPRICHNCLHGASGSCAGTGGKERSKVCANVALDLPQQGGVRLLYCLIESASLDRFQSHCSAVLLVRQFIGLVQRLFHLGQRDQIALCHIAVCQCDAALVGLDRGALREPLPSGDAQHFLQLLNTAGKAVHEINGLCFRKVGGQVGVFLYCHIFLLSSLEQVYILSDGIDTLFCVRDREDLFLGHFSRRYAGSRRVGFQAFLDSGFHCIGKHLCKILHVFLGGFCIFRHNGGDQPICGVNMLFRQHRPCGRLHLGQVHLLLQLFQLVLVAVPFVFQPLCAVHACQLFRFGLLCLLLLCKVPQGTLYQCGNSFCGHFSLRFGLLPLTGGVFCGAFCGFGFAAGGCSGGCSVDIRISLIMHLVSPPLGTYQTTDAAFLVYVPFRCVSAPLLHHFSRSNTECAARDSAVPCRCPRTHRHSGTYTAARPPLRHTALPLSV